MNLATQKQKCFLCVNACLASLKRTAAAVVPKDGIMSTSVEIINTDFKKQKCSVQLMVVFLFLSFSFK